MSAKTSITLLSVSFGNEKFIQLNRQLVEKLNPGIDYDWVVIDNSRLGNYEARSSNHFKVYEGLPHELRKDAGSYHHALGLHAGLQYVTSRYLLIMDHDFYVIRPDWIKETMEHMELKGLSFFGAVWNPRWVYQYRYFPSVHFMLIDLQQVAKDKLVFFPGIENHWQWHFLKYTPFHFGQLRDTGYQLHRQFFSDSRYAKECLVPYFLPLWGDSIYLRLESVFRRIMPDRICRIPKKCGYFISSSFLQTLCPYAYKASWEEFYWKNEAFAFHLRNIGRRHTNAPDEDIGVLEKLIHHLIT